MELKNNNRRFVAGVLLVMFCMSFFLTLAPKTVNASFWPLTGIPQNYFSIPGGPGSTAVDLGQSRRENLQGRIQGETLTHTMQMNLRELAKDVELSTIQKIEVAALTAFYNFTNFTATRLAFFFANRIAGDCPGGCWTKKSLIEGMGEVYDEVGGTLIGEISKVALSPEVLGFKLGLDICAPNVNILLNLQLGIEAAVRPKPTCTWTQIDNNWTSFKDSVTNGEIFNNVRAAYTPGKTSLSSSISVLDELVNRRITEENRTATTWLANMAGFGGFEPVTDKTTGRILVPGEAVRQQYQEAINALHNGNEAQSNAAAQAVITSGNKALIYSVVNTFGQTLLSNLLKSAMWELFTKGNKNNKSIADSLINPLAQISRIATAVIRTSFGVAKPVEQSDYDPLTEFASCDVRNRQMNNCVLDDKFAFAIRGDKEKVFTVQRAMDEGLLDGDRYFVSARDESLNQDPSCYKQQYCESNLKKLRAANVIPVGWEIVAHLSTSNKRIKLKDAVDGFNDCGPNNTWDKEAHPFCHMINPNWVLKMPTFRCLAEGFGPILEESGSSGRALTCTDAPVCIAEDNDGNCKDNNYGYCLQQKNVWRFQGDACPDHYNSCLTLTPPPAGALAAAFGTVDAPRNYLTNTLDYGICTADNAGCKSYALISNLAGKPTDPADDWQLEPSRYLNKNVEACDPNSAGCTTIFPLNPSQALNLVKNGGFEQLEDGNGDGTFEHAAGWYPRPGGAAGAAGEVVSGPDAATNAARSENGSAIRLIADAGNTTTNLVMQSNIPVLPGKTYTLSASYIRIAAAGNLDAGARIFFANQLGAYIDVGATATDPGVGALAPIGSNIVNNKHYCQFINGVVPMSDHVWAAVVGSGEVKERVLCSFTAPFGASHVSIQFNGNAFLDNVQLEQGSGTSYHEGYGGTPAKITAKVAPWYFGCTGETTDRAECAQYAGVCRENEAGCQAYTPSNGDPMVPAVVGPQDRCPAACVGYDTFKQAGTQFDAEKFPEYFIPSTARACSEQDVGCSQFTNLENEAVEYFSSLRFCQKPGLADSSVFYSWEGSDTAGYQLRKWDIKSTRTAIADAEPTLSEAILNTKSDVGATAGSAAGIAPCTKVTVTLPAGLSAPVLTCADNYTGGATDTAAKRDFGLCSRDDINNGDLDCREFYDTLGNRHYRLSSKTISVTNECKPYRITTAEAVFCPASSGYWDATKSECIYFAAASESRVCGVEANNCRAYKGNAASNVRTVVSDDFENSSILGVGTPPALDAKGWWSSDNANQNVGSIGQSSESISLGGHSLRVPSGKVAHRLVSEFIKPGNSYTLSFWARGAGDLSIVFDAPGFTSQTCGLSAQCAAADAPCKCVLPDGFRSCDVTASNTSCTVVNNNAAAAAYPADVRVFSDINATSRPPKVSLSSTWRQYSLGPVVIPGNLPFFTTGPVTLRISGTHTTDVFIDNVQLKQVQDSIYVVRDSWKTPASCDQTLEGAPSPREMLGCREYTDKDGGKQTLRSFSNLCREKAVGCSVYSASQDTPDEPYEKTFQAVCMLRDAAGAAVTCASQPSCSCDYWGRNPSAGIISGGSPRIKLLDDVCRVKFGETECRFDYDGPEFASENKDKAWVPADERMYLVVNDENKCDAAQTSCRAVALPQTIYDKECVLANSSESSESVCNRANGCLCTDPIDVRLSCTVPRGGSKCSLLIDNGTVGKWETGAIKDDPTKYSQTLCTEPALGCQAFTSDAGPFYFKDPSAKVCEWHNSVTGPAPTPEDAINPPASRTIVTKYGGWFRKSSTGADIPCYPEYLSYEGGEGIYQIYKNGNAVSNDCVAPPMSGVLSQWSANGNADDLVGGNPGSWEVAAGSSAQFAMSPFGGNAFHFDGRNQVNTAALVAATDQLRVNKTAVSISFWIYAGNFTTAGDVSVNNNLVGNDKYGVSLEFNNTISFFVGNRATGAMSVPLHTAPATEGVHHVAATYDAAHGMKLYIDGTLKGTRTATVPTSTGTSAGPMIIGSTTANYGLSVDSLGRLGINIDEVQVFGRELAAVEVSNIYRTLTKPACATGYTGWVGECQEQFNRCEEFVDPADTSDRNPRGEPYYFLINDKLDTRSCNGNVSLKEGCVLFDRTSNTNKTFASAATYGRSDKERKGGQISPENCDGAAPGPFCANRCTSIVDGLCAGARTPCRNDWECPRSMAGNEVCVGTRVYGNACSMATADQDCNHAAGWSCGIHDSYGQVGNQPITVHNDSNLILKVHLDRECSQWLECTTGDDVTDNTPGREPMARINCSSLGTCEKRDAAGTCVRWVDPEPKALKPEAYSQRDTTWYGRDYTGYSMPYAYPLQYIEPYAEKAGFCKAVDGSLARKRLGNNSCTSDSQCEINGLGANRGCDYTSKINSCFWQCSDDAQCAGFAPGQDVSCVQTMVRPSQANQQATTLGVCMVREYDCKRSADCAGSPDANAYCDLNYKGICKTANSARSGLACNTDNDCNEVDCSTRTAAQCPSTSGCKLDGVNCVANSNNICGPAKTGFKANIRSLSGADNCSSDTDCFNAANQTGATCIDHKCLADIAIGDTSVPAEKACRAYPEQDAPFPSSVESAENGRYNEATLCDGEGDVCDCSYSKINYSLKQDQQGTIKYYGLGGANAPAGLCEGGPRDGLSCDPSAVPQVCDSYCAPADAPCKCEKNGLECLVQSGQSTCLLPVGTSTCPPEVGENAPPARCIPRVNRTNLLGWSGLCLDSDASTVINSDLEQHPCSLWLPVRQLSGEPDLNNQVHEAGFVPPSDVDLNYCQVAEGRAPYKIPLIMDTDPDAYDLNDYAYQPIDDDQHWNGMFYAPRGADKLADLYVFTFPNTDMGRRDGEEGPPRIFDTYVKPFFDRGSVPGGQNILIKSTQIEGIHVKFGNPKRSIYLNKHSYRTIPEGMKYKYPGVTLSYEWNYGVVYRQTDDGAGDAVSRVLENGPGAYVTMTDNGERVGEGGWEHGRNPGLDSILDKLNAADPVKNDVLYSEGEDGFAIRAIFDNKDRLAFIQILLNDEKLQNHVAVFRNPDGALRIKSVTALLSEQCLEVAQVHRWGYDDDGASAPLTNVIWRLDRNTTTEDIATGSKIITSPPSSVAPVGFPLIFAVPDKNLMPLKPIGAQNGPFTLNNILHVPEMSDTTPLGGSRYNDVRIIEKPLDPNAVNQDQQFEVKTDAGQYLIGYPFACVGTCGGASIPTFGSRTLAYAGGRENLSKLFAGAWSVASLPETGAYQVSAGTAPTRFLWDERAKWTQPSTIDPDDLNEFQSLPPVVRSIDFSGDCRGGRCKEGAPNTFSIGELRTGEIRAYGGIYWANLRFFAYADKNHMPIRRVAIDWGDDKEPMVSTGHFKNRRGLDENGAEICGTDDYGFGSQPQACDTNWYSKTHLYKCTLAMLEDLDACTTTPPTPTNFSPCRRDGACVFRPAVQLLDNWGVCNGTVCSGGPGGSSNVCMNTELGPDVGTREPPSKEIGSGNECSTIRTRGMTTYPWTSWGGEIVVSPEVR